LTTNHPKRPAPQPFKTQTNQTPNSQTTPPGFKALVEAFTEVTGSCAPYSITGSLPCIRELQEAGFDVQTLGFGKLAAYHANDEHALLSDFEKGFRVLASLLAKF
jgi:acetylornithine deacetylase